MKRFRKAYLLFTLILTAYILPGCGGDAGNGHWEKPLALLVSLAITPPTPNIPISGFQQFTATATYGDGSTRDVTTSSNWTSANPGVATVSPTTGGAVGVASGTSVITADFGGMSNTATLTVNDATSQSFVVYPATRASIPVTGNQQYTAIETFSDGTSYDRTATSSWTSIDAIAGTGVATLSLDGINGGLATGAVTGDATITATFVGVDLLTKTASAPLTVNAATSTKFEVTPSILVTIPVTGTQQYAAIETFSDGTSFDRTATSAWSAIDAIAGTGVATLSLDGITGGLATGAATGDTTITATFIGVDLLTQTATAPLTVNNASLVSILVTPALAAIPVNGAQQYMALAIYDVGLPIDITENIGTSWTSTDVIPGTGVATLSPDGGVGAGLATGMVSGTTTITAFFGTMNGTATLTVNDATSVSFTVTPATATISISGGSQQFAAIETFSDGSTADRTLLSTWSSVDLTGGPGVSTIGLNTGLATGAVIGQSTITATYVGVDLISQTADAILTVTAPEPGIAGAAPDLGMAATFGIIATNAITSSSVKSHIYGDVALTTGVISSVTGPGFKDAGAAPNLTSSGVTTSDGVTPGIINTSDNGNLTIAELAQLQSDLNAAYLDLSGRPATTIYPAGANELSGLVLLPGVYAVGAKAPADTYALSDINGPLVLDAAGNPDAVFVLQAGAITTTTGSVLLQGGAQAKNVFWVLTSDATIGNGTSTFFQGTIVAGNTITVGLDTNVQGRMLAGALGAGSITNSGVITVPK